MKKIVYEGTYNDVNRDCSYWNKKDIPFNYEIDGESLISIMRNFEGKNIRLSIETVEPYDNMDYDY
jgi:hypothetical protein